MTHLQEAIPSVCASQYEAKLLWAACCLSNFGFMRSGEFILARTAEPALYLLDMAIDSHHTPSILRVRLYRAKTNTFGRGVEIFMSRTGTTLCPVVAILRYLAVCGSLDGPLLIHTNGLPLTRDQFMSEVKKALQTAQIDSTWYSSHSFWIGAVSAAAAAGVPAYFIKMLGRWESEAYHLYIRTPFESLEAVTQLIAQ